MTATQKKQKKSTLQRRKLAIISAILLIAILSASLVGVLEYAKTYEITDPADGTTYYIRNKTGSYLLYDKDKNLMPDGGVTGKYYYKTQTGTLIEVKPDTGAAKIIAAIDVPDSSLGESMSYSNILPFAHVPDKSIRSVEIVNSNGSYRLDRYNADGELDDNGTLILSGFPQIALDKDGFARICNSVGLPVCKKLENPKKDANGAYTEYGLAPETRIDEDGKSYEYTPDYFIMTDTAGKQYKMLVGDRLVTDEGYYVQYYPYDEQTASFVARDVVYIMPTSAGESLKNGVEKLIKPVLTYPMDSNSYYKINHLMVLERDESKASKYDSVLPSVSYVPQEDRRNTVNAARVYSFNYELRALIPDADQIRYAMNQIVAPEVEEIVLFNPSPEKMAEYGLYRIVSDKDGNPVLDENGELQYEEAPAFRINFDYPQTIKNDDGTTTKQTVRNYILVAPVTVEKENGERFETGDYYTYTYYSILDESGNPGDVVLYPWINQVKAETLNFLTFNRFDWTDEFLISVDQAYMSKISISSELYQYSAIFELDNSKSSAPEGVMTVDQLTVFASDSAGNVTQTFPGLHNIHVRNIPTGTTTAIDSYWTVTSKGITAKDAKGNDLTIAEYYYETNKLGTQVTCLKKPIIAADGSYIYVYANTVEVKKDGKTTTYLRYDTPLFQEFYKNLLYTTVGGSYELSEEKEALLTGDPGKLVCTMEIVENAGTVKKPNLVTNTYRFYSLAEEGSSRKLYMTVNGDGGLYVLRAQVERMFSDAKLFFAGEPIN